MLQCPSSLLLQAQKPRRYFLTDHRSANRPVVKADENLAEALKTEQKFVPPAGQKAPKIALKWKLLAFVAGFGVSTYLVEKYYLRPNYEVYVGTLE